MLRCLKRRLDRSDGNQTDDVGYAVDFCVELAHDCVRFARIADVENDMFAISFAAEIIRRLLVGDPHTRDRITHIFEFHGRVRWVLTCHLHDDVPNTVGHLFGSHIGCGWSGRRRRRRGGGFCDRVLVCGRGRYGGCNDCNKERKARAELHCYELRAFPVATLLNRGA